MGTGKRFIKNSFANYGQKIIRSGIGILTIGMIARHLGPDAFGQYAYILAFVTISEVTAGMGVPMIFCREVAKDRAKAPQFLAAGLILQSVLSVVTLGIVSIVFYAIAPSKHIFYVALICVVAELFKFLGRFFWAVYQAYERMGFGTLQTFITQTLYLLLVVVAIAYDVGLKGIFGALLGAHLTGCVFAYVVVTRLFARPEYSEVKGLSKFLFKEAYPLAIRGMFRKFNLRAGILILAAMRTKFDVGMFSGPHKIILNLMFIGEASSQALFPVLSRLKEESGSSLTLRLAYEKSLKFALVLGLSLAIFLSTFSDSIVVLVFGKQYVQAAPALGILAWCIVPLFLTSFLEKTLVAGDKQFLTTVGMGVALGVNVLLNFLLIPQMGYKGSCIAALVAEMAPVCFGVYFILKHFRLKVFLPDIIKPLLAGLVTYGILSMFNGVHFLLGGVIEVGIYGGILFAIRTFTQDEISFFKQVLARTPSSKPVGV
jgi:O-antigen/teichoic acid export membrane protein